MKHVQQRINDAVLMTSIKTQNCLVDAVRNHTRSFVIANRVMAMTGLFLIADQAMAAGLGAWASKFKAETLQPLLDFGMYTAYAGGVGCSGMGVNKFIKLSKGDPQTTFGEGAGWTFGGGALMGLGAIANQVGESMSTGNCALGAYCGR